MRKIQILNLSNGFMPLGPSTIVDRSRPFPSKIESNIDLENIFDRVPVTITIRFDNEDANIMKLLLATNALRKSGVSKIHLFISFLPYARQDRLEPEWVGQAFSLEVFADLINSQNYDSVSFFDPHSIVAQALIRNSKPIANDKFVSQVFKGKQGFHLVSPDAGAAKKIKHVAKVTGFTGKPVQALKYRVNDGKIESIEIFEQDLGGLPCYIVDDICDGGATFIALASELKKRNAGEIYLVVSHGIFSRGLLPLVEGGVAHIYTTDSFKSQEASEFLTEVKLCDILT